MNTEELYHAQLNALEKISVNSIKFLIDKLSIIGEAFYNYTSRCIEIEESEQTNDLHLKSILRDWLSESDDIDEDDKKILLDNIDFVFNITKITSDINKPIIQIYLY